MLRSLDRLWLVPAIVVLGIGALTLNPAPVGVLHDDAIYVILAKSIATGQGYRYLNLPGAPAATHFPPGYPFFLSLLWRVAPSFPGNVALFKATNVLALGITFALVAWFIHRQFSVRKSVAALLALVATVGVPTLLLSGLVLSEPLFLVLAVLALILAEQYTSREASVSQLVILGLLCGVAALVRTAGIALLGAVVVRLLLSRRVRDAAVASITACGLLVPWQLWVKAHGHEVPLALQGAYGPYADWFGQAIREHGFKLVVATIGQTWRQTLDFIVDTICPIQNSGARVAASVVLAVGVLLGARRAWRRAPATLLFLAFYLVLVLAWPVPPARYIWGVWPLLLFIPGLAVAEVQLDALERIQAEVRRSEQPRVQRRRRDGYDSDCGTRRR